MTKKGFIGINLPVDLVEELKLWKRAFVNTYNQNVTYERMFREMINVYKLSNAEVTNEFDAIIKKHPILNNHFEL